MKTLSLARKNKTGVDAHSVHMFFTLGRKVTGSGTSDRYYVKATVYDFGSHRMYPLIIPLDSTISRRDEAVLDGLSELLSFMSTKLLITTSTISIFTDESLLRSALNGSAQTNYYTRAQAMAVMTKISKMITVDKNDVAFGYLNYAELGPHLALG